LQSELNENNHQRMDILFTISVNGISIP